MTIIAANYDVLHMLTGMLLNNDWLELRGNMTSFEAKLPSSGMLLQSGLHHHIVLYSFVSTLKDGQMWAFISIIEYRAVMQDVASQGGDIKDVWLHQCNQSHVNPGV